MWQRTCQAFSASKDVRHNRTTWLRGSEDGIAAVSGPGWPRSPQDRQACGSGTKAFTRAATARWTPKPAAACRDAAASAVPSLPLPPLPFSSARSPASKRRSRFGSGPKKRRRGSSNGLSESEARLRRRALAERSVIARIRARSAPAVEAHASHRPPRCTLHPSRSQRVEYARILRRLRIGGTRAAESLKATPPQSTCFDKACAGRRIQTCA